MRASKKGTGGFPIQCDGRTDVITKRDACQTDVPRAIHCVNWLQNEAEVGGSCDPSPPTNGKLNLYGIVPHVDDLLRCLVDGRLTNVDAERPDVGKNAPRNTVMGNEQNEQRAPITAPRVVRVQPCAEPALEAVPERSEFNRVLSASILLGRRRRKLDSWVCLDCSRPRCRSRAVSPCRSWGSSEFTASVSFCTPFAGSLRMNIGQSANGNINLLRFAKNSLRHLAYDPPRRFA